MIKTKTSITTIGASKYILIPYELLSDSVFPFIENDNLEMEIAGSEILVRRKRQTK